MASPSIKALQGKLAINPLALRPGMTPPRTKPIAQQEPDGEAQESSRETRQPPASPTFVPPSPDRLVVPTRPQGAANRRKPTINRKSIIDNDATIDIAELAANNDMSSSGRTSPSGNKTVANAQQTSKSKIIALIMTFVSFLAVLYYMLFGASYEA